MPRWFGVVAAYGILNAAAYSCLLPLWEGFDEAYHYGYVEWLAARHEFPRLNEAMLTQEIWHSMEIVPVSHYLQPFTRAPMNFSNYFALSGAERAARRRQLASLPTGERFALQADKPNYEVNQAPLPYLFMAPVDAALSGLSIAGRVLALRLLCSVVTVLLIAHSVLLLSRQLSISEPPMLAALFCVFSSQMLYAAMCHVANDWLAVPLMMYLLWAAIRVWRRGSRTNYLALGAILSAALLTKSYFVFLLPLAAAIAAWPVVRRRTPLIHLVWFAVPLAVLTGPWYARNLLLYHNLSGTVEQTRGVNAASFMNAALALPWGESIGYMAHASLWTGNNSFTTFSAATLNLALILLAAGVVCKFVFTRPSSADWIVIAAVVLFSAGLALVSVAFFISSKGGAIAAVPWYMQVLLAPMLLIAFQGMARVQLLLKLSVLLWAYMMTATYLVKLAPMYGGLPPSRTRVADLWNWYLSANGDWTASMVSAPVLWALIGATVVLCMALSARLIFRS